MDSAANLLNQPLDIQELAISVSAQNLNHTILNVDFLKSSGIVPTDWELARQPVLNATQARLSFKSGLSIVAQPKTVTFVEALRSQDAKTPEAPSVARKYIEKLPYANYQGVSIAPKSIISFPSSADAARKYIVETLLSPGPWREVGQGLPQAAVSFVYRLDHCQLNLSLAEVRVRQNEQVSVPAILFSGSFNYGVTNSAGEQLPQIYTRLDNWSADLETFREIVYQKFLGKKEDSIFPSQILPS